MYQSCVERYRLFANNASEILISQTDSAPSLEIANVMRGLTASSTARINLFGCSDICCGRNQSVLMSLVRASKSGIERRGKCLPAIRV